MFELLGEFFVVPLSKKHLGSLEFGEHISTKSLDAQMEIGGLR